MGLSELCGDECPQQLFGCPFSLPPIDGLQESGSDSCCPSAPVQLQSQLFAETSQWACGNSPALHDNHGLPNSCFFQLHMRGEHLLSEGPDCGTVSSGASASHMLQVEFSLPSSSSSSTAVLPSHFQAFSSLLHPSPVQHPRSLTQWRGHGDI